MIFNASPFMHEIVTSGFFFGLVLVVRFALIRTIRGKKELPSKEQRRWITRVKSGTFVVILVGLIMIWAPQLQTLALSLTAFAVAFVVATKEMILCVTGSLLRVSTKLYKVGDWIVIDGVMGEVVDIDPFSTRVEEIDPKTASFTGKKVTIPNGKLFTAQVENRGFHKNYIFQDISLIVQSTDLGPNALFDRFQNIVNHHASPLREEAEKFMKRVAHKAGIDFKSSDPSFGLRTTELGHYVFTAKIFVPTPAAEIIGLNITKDFLEYAYAERNKARLAQQNDLAAYNRVSNTELG